MKASLYLLDALWANESNLAPVMAPGKVNAIIRPRTCLAWLVFIWWHHTKTDGILCQKHHRRYKFLTTFCAALQAWYKL